MLPLDTNHAIILNWIFLCSISLAAFGAPEPINPGALWPDANEWGQISTSNKMLDLLPPVGIGLGMARLLRINVPGAWHHVTARGNERRRIFRADRDYARLMEILEELGKKAGGVDYAAVGMALRRFESKMRKGGQLGREAGLLEDQLFPVET